MQADAVYAAVEEFSLAMQRDKEAHHEGMMTHEVEAAVGGVNGNMGTDPVMDVLWKMQTALRVLGRI